MIAVQKEQDGTDGKHSTVDQTLDTSTRGWPSVTSSEA